MREEEAADEPTSTDPKMENVPAKKAGWSANLTPKVRRFFST